jgi:aminomethyltransferase
MNMVLQHTPLHTLHTALGAKIVPFAGYQMPLQYAGIMAEHLHTREHASLFDVSHMGQCVLKGADVAEFLETLVPSDITTLAPHQMRYSVLLNKNGGIIDDVMITRREDDFLVVVNAARKAVDFEHFKAHLPATITLTELPHYALIAIQGLAAESILAAYTPLAKTLNFMTGGFTEILGIPCYLTRSGYTGEDGFEISVVGDVATKIATELLKNPLLKPAGLGARDTLRLEAGLCLYGHDLDEATSPVAASLSWVIGKQQRQSPRFLAAEKILAELAGGAATVRLGFVVNGKAPLREGATIHAADGTQIGVITSGTHSPTLGYPIAMGYVQKAFAKETTFHAKQRDRDFPLTRTKMPFVANTYKK